MKVSEVKETYDDYSKTASELVRKLALAGLAAIWVFADSARTTEENIADLPRALLLAGVFFAAALGFDLLHYSLSALVYGWKIRNADEEGLSPNDEIDVFRQDNLPGFVFYVAKQVAVAIGYVILVIAVLQIAF